MSDQPSEAALALQQIFDLKDEIAAKEKQFKAWKDKRKAQIEAIEQAFHAELEETGVDSMKIKGVGTVYTEPKVMPSVVEGGWDQLHNWIIENDRLDILQKRLNAKAISDEMDAGYDLPPGVKVHIEEQLRARRGS